MKNIAIIPARGGSKRIPRKNIKLFMGKPIIAYSIEAALQSGLFDEVMVSTEDEEIAEIAKHYGAKVPFLRSDETANDFATTVDVIMEVLKKYEEKGLIFDSTCCIYATAPFVTSHKLQQAYQLLNENKFNSVYPVVAFAYPIQRGLKIENNKLSMVYPEYLNRRTQDLKVIYHDVGQFYISRIDVLKREKSFLGENTGGMIISELESQDMDTEIDWKLAELKYMLLKNDKKDIF